MATQELSSFMKLGNQGGTGTGKSTTAALLLLGLSIEYHGKAPVLVYDTEPGWHFIKPIFDIEGVNLIIERGRHFKGMLDALSRGRREGACGFAVDSITHPWGELLERFADKSGRVPFHKFNQIKPMWNDWTVEFLNAPFHCIANGRLSWEYIMQQAEDGKYEPIKGDTKMKAGGGESFGYEPHLTCELDSKQVRDGSGKLKGMEYVCLVLKDRSRALNGQEFTFKDIGAYKKGAYKQVLDAFRPHIEAIRLLAGVTMPKDNSAGIVPGGDAEFFHRQQQKTATLEDWYACMDMVLPGRTDEGKRQRLIVTAEITGVRSKTRFEAYDLSQLLQCVGVLQAFERRVKSEFPDGLAKIAESDLIALVSMAKEDFRSGPKEMTLLEARLKQSVDEVDEEEVVPQVPF